MTVLVTGASGFVGRGLCAELRRRNISVRGAVRRAPDNNDVMVGDISPGTDWTAALQDCSAVVHLAARVHVMTREANPLSSYRLVNVEATEHLARTAAAQGVKRFVFVSSIKVNGESTWTVPFRSTDEPAPIDPYGVSKLEAEQRLAQVAQDTGLEVVVVRPPLIYGPGVKANFLQLIRLVQRGWPLPFGNVRNARSMVAMDNLVDLLMTCVVHPAAPGQTFLVSDNDDLSLTELIHHVAAGLGHTPRLFSVPPGLMWSAARAVGKGAVAARLLGSLQVDIQRTRELLGWEPVVTPSMGVRACVSDFLEKQSSCNEAYS